MSRTGDITLLLQATSKGDPQAAETLLSRVYAELQALAASMLARETPGQTLQRTALVHEAWLRLGLPEGGRCPDRAYFFAAAGEAMRRILVENARRKKRLKRGGNLVKVDIDEVDLPAPLPDDALIALHEALSGLEQVQPRAAEVVKLCYFVGLTHEETAEQLGVSLSTVERTWAYARAWLYREIQSASGHKA